jgi:hypothetical protein
MQQLRDAPTSISKQRHKASFLSVSVESEVPHDFTKLNRYDLPFNAWKVYLFY